MNRNVLDSKQFQKETGSVLNVERNTKWKLMMIDLCVEIIKILHTQFGVSHSNSIRMSILE